MKFTKKCKNPWVVSWTLKSKQKKKSNRKNFTSKYYNIPQGHEKKQLYGIGAQTVNYLKEQIDTWKNVS